LVLLNVTRTTTPPTSFADVPPNVVTMTPGAAPMGASPTRRIAEAT